MIGEMPTSNLMLDDLQKTVYSEIKQPQAQATPPTGGKLVEVNSCGPEEQCHPTSHSSATGESCSSVELLNIVVSFLACSILLSLSQDDNTHTHR